MLLKLGSVWLPRAPMEVELRLDQANYAYTGRDMVSGEVILPNYSAADLSTVVLKLSGTTTSRLSHTSRTETHEIFKKSQQIFPPDVLQECKNSHIHSNPQGGNYTLPFSIAIPQVTECYKTDHWSNKSSVTCTSIRHWRTQKEHLLRKSPPSTGDSNSPAEVKYTLSAVVTGKGVVKKTHNISFKPLSEPLPEQKPLEQGSTIDISPHIVSTSPLSFKIHTELQNGPCLLLGQSIPLKINVTKYGDARCEVKLSEFQTMLIEKTQVKVQGTTESSVSTWIVQSSANMNYSLGLENAPVGSTATLGNSLYCDYSLPPGLTSSFEVCNITRTHRLVLRLGFLVGNLQTQTVIQEFDFPVYVMGSTPLIPI